MSAKPPQPVLPPSKIETVALLNNDRFDELDRRFSKVQKDYEKGKITDVDLRAAFRAFYSPDASLEARYASWVGKYPKSYVAHLASGIYFKKVGEASRGGDTIDKTSDAQLHGMETAFDKATREFEASAALDPKPLLTYLYAMGVAMYLGDDTSIHENLDRAIKADPGNVIVRQNFMGTLRPRWGGRPGQMAEFLEDSRKAGLSPARLQFIEAVIVEDDAHQDAEAGNLGSAETKYFKAIALGADACRRCLGEVLVREKKFEDAIEVLSSALDFDPLDVGARVQRAVCYLTTGKIPQSFADFLITARAQDAFSENQLAAFYLWGIPGTLPANPEEGISWLRKAAAQGYPQAIQNLDRAEKSFPAAAAR